jgi:2-polyprenyl-6-methoxyphenol hydroxylase-like FAD-dependent oxidoreductase
MHTAWPGCGAELKKFKNCKASICSLMKSLQKHARAHLFGGDAGGLKRAIANDGSGLMTMRDADVLIAGAGPTGLTLAGELALAGVDVAIVERRPNQDLPGSRAGGLHSRTIEVLDQRGIAERFLSQGQKAQVAGFASVRLDISDFPTRHNYGLGLWQNHIERILAGWVGELGVTIHRGREVKGFAQDDTGVDVELVDDQSLRAEYLVGCDGGRSVIRKAAGIEFPEWDPTTSSLIAEVEMAEEPEWGIHRNAFGIHSFGRLEYEIRDGEVVYMDGGPVRIMVTELHVGPATEPTLRDLSEALIAVCGTDYGIHSPTWISRFTDMTRQAAAYRKGKVLLAGDAAHVHAPDGGQGPQHRCAGCGEPGMEAGPGGQPDIAGKSPGYLPRRAPPGRCPRAAQHDGGDRASPRGRTHAGTARHHVRAPRHGGASQSICCDAVRSGHSLRSRQGAPARFGDGDLATTFSGTLSQETRMLAVFFLGLRDRWPVLRIRSKCSHHSSGL